ncbi:hypothetical protein PPYR_03607 [Photinus pyralis]|uniref:Cytochrome b-c1 complex subunit 6 n=2 Tax=Photinus pyralis TaxID=7054 RepID=A0A5N4A3B7_PHOPY|nr:cytochrome b-c1 complex subunit 6, mitochondrial [Photinus pyralis]KAB0791807.1 hypothetical protein PPYR_03607 [Photinus pyralis]
MWLKNFLNRLIPTVKAEDEDLVDPLDTLRDKCKATSHVKHLAEKLEECNNRVNSRSRTAETCIEEVIDFMHALDHCVSKDLFAYLK